MANPIIKAYKIRGTNMKFTKELGLQASQLKDIVGGFQKLLGGLDRPLKSSFKLWMKYALCQPQSKSSDTLVVLKRGI